MSARLSSDDFTPHLHSIFKIEMPAALELELREISDRSNARVEQFSLLFEGPASPCLAQGTYALIHEQMKELPLFLVPLGLRDGRMIYQAVFTRIVADQGASRES
jgi:Domain of unknown function (DUF6916)